MIGLLVYMVCDDLLCMNISVGLWKHSFVCAMHLLFPLGFFHRPVWFQLNIKCEKWIWCQKIRELSTKRRDREMRNEKKRVKEQQSKHHRSPPMISCGNLERCDDYVESESQELDLNLQVPSGWENHLDLKVNWCSHLGFFHRPVWFQFNIKCEKWIWCQKIRELSTKRRDVFLNIYITLELKA
ncbi:hypothetical protein POTOM_016857 [Populus tomentosa]|uniref:Uncharacterized protein n=1 Tax=Populus tomentosa TaxID=118781 RepID=A0A8X7ZZ96_POPTO|nr:hypothetical protein POTOM_016857 [Populus tomentosa]